MHLENQLGQIEPGQPRVYRRALRDEAERLLDLVERLDRQVRADAGPHDLHRRVVGRTLGGLAPGEASREERRPSSWSADGDTPFVRHITGRAASQAAPDSKPLRGSA
jgi:hypothetical protein